MTASDSPYDAILIVGFGGPEKPDDVIPFLENVLRGKNVPRERMLEVADHYYHFDGRSPINDQMRALMAALQPELTARNINLPIYWGNRNWHPLLAETLRTMAAAGVKRAMAYVASAYSSYSGCRQYLGDIERACQAAGSGAPRVDKLRVFYNHPLFVAASALRLAEGMARVPAERRGGVNVVFTAHSIPESFASTCQYESQLRETCRLTTVKAGLETQPWQLVYQSRSGRPQDPWLAPDVLDHLRELRRQGVSDVVMLPIGFLSDHIEVLYDLDYEARRLADELGLSMIRAATVGVHPLFVQMVVELIAERLSAGGERLACGIDPPWPDTCAADCCPLPGRGPISSPPSPVGRGDAIS